VTQNIVPGADTDTVSTLNQTNLNLLDISQQKSNFWSCFNGCILSNTDPY
jgi:hypothetical protein